MKLRLMATKKVSLCPLTSEQVKPQSKFSTTLPSTRWTNSCLSKTANFVKLNWAFKISSQPNRKELGLDTWAVVSSLLWVILSGHKIQKAKFGYCMNWGLNVPLTWAPGFVPHNDVNFTLQLPFEQACTQASGQARSDDQDPGHVEDDTEPRFVL